MVQNEHEDVVVSSIAIQEKVKDPALEEELTPGEAGDATEGRGPIIVEERPLTSEEKREIFRQGEKRRETAREAQSKEAIHSEVLADDRAKEARTKEVEEAKRKKLEEDWEKFHAAQAEAKAKEEKAAEEYRTMFTDDEGGDIDPTVPIQSQSEQEPLVQSDPRTKAIHTEYGDQFLVPSDGRYHTEKELRAAAESSQKELDEFLEKTPIAGAEYSARKRELEVAAEKARKDLEAVSATKQDPTYASFNTPTDPRSNWEKADEWAQTALPTLADTFARANLPYRTQQMFKMFRQGMRAFLTGDTLGAVGQSIDTAMNALTMLADGTDSFKTAVARAYGLTPEAVLAEGATSLKRRVISNETEDTKEMIRKTLDALAQSGAESFGIQDILKANGYKWSPEKLQASLGFSNDDRARLEEAVNGSGKFTDEEKDELMFILQYGRYGQDPQLVGKLIGTLNGSDGVNPVHEAAVQGLQVDFGAELGPYFAPIQMYVDQFAKFSRELAKMKSEVSTQLTDSARGYSQELDEQGQPRVDSDGNIITWPASQMSSKQRRIQMAKLKLLNQFDGGLRVAVQNYPDLAQGMPMPTPDGFGMGLVDTSAYGTLASRNKALGEVWDKAPSGGAYHIIAGGKYNEVPLIPGSHGVPQDVMKNGKYLSEELAHQLDQYRIAQLANNLSIEEIRDQPAYISIYNAIARMTAYRDAQTMVELATRSGLPNAQQLIDDVFDWYEDVCKKYDWVGATAPLKYEEFNSMLTPQYLRDTYGLDVLVQTDNSVNHLFPDQGLSGEFKVNPVTGGPQYAGDAPKRMYTLLELNNPSETGGSLFSLYQKLDMAWTGGDRSVMLPGQISTYNRLKVMRAYELRDREFNKMRTFAQSPYFRRRLGDTQRLDLLGRLGSVFNTSPGWKWQDGEVDDTYAGPSDDVAQFRSTYSWDPEWDPNSSADQQKVWDWMRSHDLIPDMGNPEAVGINKYPGPEAEPVENFKGTRLDISKTVRRVIYDESNPTDTRIGDMLNDTLTHDVAEALLARIQSGELDLKRMQSIVDSGRLVPITAEEFEAYVRAGDLDGLIKKYEAEEEALYTMGMIKTNRTAYSKGIKQAIVQGVMAHAMAESEGASLEDMFRVYGEISGDSDRAKELLDVVRRNISDDISEGRAPTIHQMVKVGMDALLEEVNDKYAPSAKYTKKGKRAPLAVERHTMPEGVNPFIDDALFEVLDSGLMGTYTFTPWGLPAIKKKGSEFEAGVFQPRDQYRMKGKLEDIIENTGDEELKEKLRVLRDVCEVVNNILRPGSKTAYLPNGGEGFDKAAITQRLLEIRLEDRFKGDADPEGFEKAWKEMAESEFGVSIVSQPTLEEEIRSAKAIVEPFSPGIPSEKLVGSVPYEGDLGDIMDIGPDTPISDYLSGLGLKPWDYRLVPVTKGEESYNDLTFTDPENGKVVGRLREEQNAIIGTKETGSPIKDNIKKVIQGALVDAVIEGTGDIKILKNKMKGNSKTRPKNISNFVKHHPLGGTEAIPGARIVLTAFEKALSEAVFEGEGFNGLKAATYSSFRNLMDYANTYLTTICGGDKDLADRLTKVMESRLWTAADMDKKVRPKGDGTQEDYSPYRIARDASNALRDAYAKDEGMKAAMDAKRAREKAEEERKAAEATKKEQAKSFSTRASKEKIKSNLSAADDEIRSIWGGGEEGDVAITIHNLVRAGKLGEFVNRLNAAPDEAVEALWGAMVKGTDQEEAMYDTAQKRALMGGKILELYSPKKRELRPRTPRAPREEKKPAEVATVNPAEASVDDLMKLEGNTKGLDEVESMQSVGKLVGDILAKGNHPELNVSNDPSKCNHPPLGGIVGIITKGYIEGNRGIVVGGVKGKNDRARRDEPWEESIHAIRSLKQNIYNRLVKDKGAPVKEYLHGKGYTIGSEEYKQVANALVDKIFTEKVLPQIRAELPKAYDASEKTAFWSDDGSGGKGGLLRALGYSEKEIEKMSGAYRAGTLLLRDETEKSTYVEPPDAVKERFGGDGPGSRAHYWAHVRKMSDALGRVVSAGGNMSELESAMRTFNVATDEELNQLKELQSSLPKARGEERIKLLKDRNEILVQVLDRKIREGKAPKTAEAPKEEPVEELTEPVSADVPTEAPTEEAPAEVPTERPVDEQEDVPEALRKVWEDHPEIPGLEGIGDEYRVVRDELTNALEAGDDELEDVINRLESDGQMGSQLDRIVDEARYSREGTIDETDLANLVLGTYLEKLFLEGTLTSDKVKELWGRLGIRKSASARKVMVIRPKQR